MEPTVSVDQEMPTDMEDLCEEFKEHPDFYWVEIQIRLHLQVEVYYCEWQRLHERHEYFCVDSTRHQCAQMVQE